MEQPTTRTVTYLRSGRVKRASGDIIEKDAAKGMTKATPHRSGWGAIWLTTAEIEAGKEKPAPRPRRTADTPPVAPRRPRTPKPPPPPAWRVLVDRVRLFEIDHHPKGWPGVQMEFVTALADELEAARAELAQYLPLAASNAQAMAPPPQRLPSTKDVPGG